MKSRKIARFLIFIGLLLVGTSCYMLFIGDIPVIENFFGDIRVKDNEVIGPSIEVKKIDAIQYNDVGGTNYTVNKEEIDGNVSKDFFVNVLLGNEPYRLSFKYPEDLTLLKGDDNSIILGNDYTNISFSYTEDKFEDYVDWYKTGERPYNYYVKNYSVNNEVSNVYIFNVYEGNDELFINKAFYLIYNLNGDGKAIKMDVMTKNKIIPDSLLINIYNSFVFEKTNHDFEFCKKEDNQYKCSFKLNNYVNSNNKEVTLEFDEGLYKVEQFSSENTLLSSALSLTKEDNSKGYDYANISFKILYEGTTLIKTETERNKYVEEVINGRKYLIKHYNNPNKKILFYEIEPNLYVRISIDSTSEEFFDEAFRIFTDFKIR